MKFRTLALALALGMGLTMAAEAKKKPYINHHPKSHVVKVKKFKGHKIKRAKTKIRAKR